MYAALISIVYYVQRTLVAPRIAQGRTAGIEPFLFVPFLVLQMYWHSLIWIAALWAVTFPASTAALAVVFRRARVA